MAKKHHSVNLFEEWHSIALFGLLGLVLALLISFVQPLQYSSTIRLLILQDSGSSVDAYTASRADERIAENLATILFTSTFFDQVMDSGFSIDRKTFPENDRKRRRVWSRAVDASVTRGSGLLTISTYHKDVTQAEQIARAIAFVLTRNVSDYTSGGSVQVSLVDSPLNSRWPVKPNILANSASGFFLGCLIGIALILTKSERLRRRHQLT